MQPETKRLALALSLGAIAGMRSLSAPAIVSHRLSHHLFGWPRDGVERLLRHELAAQLLIVGAAAEMIGDKLPFTPRRTRLLPLAMRAAGGAMAGWAVGRTRDSRAFLATVGGVTAVATAIAVYALRTTIAERSIIPDAFLGLAEDAAVVGLAKKIRI